jgi:vitamin B12 transporter
VRVNDPSSPGGGFDFGNLLAGAVERVEVLRGPNSVAWGSQAVGGVVNIVTEDGGEGPSFRGNAEYGDARSFTGNAAVRVRGERVRGALTAGYTRTGGISAAATGSETDGFRQFGTTGRLGVELTRDVSLDFRGYYADSRLEYDSNFPPPNFSLSDSDHVATAEQVHGYAGLRANLLNGDFDNRIGITIQRIDRDDFAAANAAAPIFFGRGRSERYTYQGHVRPIDAVQAVFGVERENSRFRADGGVAARTGITSAYGELIVAPVEQVTLTGGIRRDDHEDFGGHTSFGVNAAVRPLEGTVLRGSFGEGFKAPTLYQLHGPFGTATLRPEEAESYEAGVDQSFLDGNVRFSASWFHRDTINQIDFSLATFTYANIARTRTEGFELEFVAQPVEALVFEANYTNLKAENRSPGANLGKDLARRPRETASFSLDYGFDFGLKAGATLRIAGDSFDNAGNTVRLEGYTVAGIRAEFDVSDQFSVYGRVDNLFDQRYQTVASYNSMGRAAYAGLRLKL